MEEIERYKMVGECTDSYRSLDTADGTADINMIIPARFKNLWLYKLEQLCTDDQEIAHYSDINQDSSSKSKTYHMIKDCVEEFQSEIGEDGRFYIHIKAPKQFGLIWEIKFSDLFTSMDEIQKFQPSDWD